ncbi:sulfatase-like hydrolase/transferase [Helicobacter sp.]|uniref:sulfatase-like hydrolase/transferase n=1 Tax=Helicobacter sp. TaxID=218 RepID=UPI0019BC8DD1|nr:sulfatase-like hydrolase/transferase [Helicobacter sp.]MBD5164566.1 sulfatase-like hydrolase/transferase [Helicobacter sp.]
MLWQIIGGGGQLALFSDTIASFAQTKLALQHLLNFSSAGDKQWNQSLDLINLFSLAGYKTAIFSNQEIVGSEVNAFASIASFADSKANPNRFITSSRIAESQITYDGFLLPFIQSAFEQNPSKPCLDIIHLMGTHFNYDKRYPKEFAKFNADDITYPSFATNEQKRIIATYANAVLYNDYILNEIFKIYSKSDSIIFYLSDHGESLYEYKGKLGIL